MEQYSFDRSTDVNNHFFMCDCNSEALLCTRFPDEEVLYLSIYYRGQFHRKPKILERLKYCWYHLTTGKIYEDQMVLTLEKAKQLCDWLTKNTQSKR